MTIVMKNLIYINACMRCIGICPKAARNVDQNLWSMMAEKMTPVLGRRKENHSDHVQQARYI